MKPHSLLPRGGRLAGGATPARRLVPALLAVALAWSAAGAGTPRQPWDLQALQRPPGTDWGGRSNGVQALYYQGEPWNGKPTRVFAWLARPEGRGPFPGLVLVHGGGGKAFADWAEYWAKRGYVAIAMDLAGCGPEGRLADGGPDQSDATKFRDFGAADAGNMWTYHAVADAIRAHSLLLGLPEVDQRRTGLTGISWGGYLTCIIAGVDHRFKVAVPVYGCGFLDENSCWLGTLAGMPPERRERWVRYFDPSSYLGRVQCPILFLNGAADFAYPLDSYKKSYSLVKSPRWVSVQIGLAHGHIWTFGEVSAFVDWALKGEAPLPQVSAMRVRDGKAWATVNSQTGLARAELCYTTSSGAWPQRKWQSQPAAVENRKVSAALPSERPLVCFLAVTDRRGLQVSTQHEELR
jgi:cephalosporin-C deacetylase-like acetyl esterase